MDDVVQAVESAVETAVDAGQIAGNLVKKFNPVSVLIRCVTWRLVNRFYFTMMTDTIMNHKSGPSNATGK